jgi:cytoskeletal protein RodZ
MQKNAVGLVLVGTLLAACGGGSGNPGSRSVSLPSSPAPSPAPTPTPTSTPSATEPPATSITANTISAVNSTVSGTGDDWLVQSNSMVNLNLSGAANNVTFSDSQSAGNVVVSGNANTVVFRPGATASNVNLTGTGNTIWVPTNGNVSLSGDLSGNTIVNYTP